MQKLVGRAVVDVEHSETESTAADEIHVSTGSTDTSTYESEFNCPSGD